MTSYEIDIIIAVITGIVAGIMSSIGGAGSLLSLPVLVGMGLPPVIANATNRMGVITVYTFAYAEFRQHHKVAIRHALFYAIPIIIGTGVGALLASITSNAAMQWVVIGATVIMVLLTALSPELINQRNATKNAASRLNVWGFAVMLIIGLYTGFIEQAMTFMIFFALVRVLGVEMETARGIKSFLAMIAPPIALIVFILFGHVNWAVGLFLALGSALGGWIGGVMQEKESTRKLRFQILLSLGLSLLYLTLFVLKHYFDYGTSYL